MSLVGSLEDLDLGDILQIIHLSRKSGALRLQTETGAGQILFREGLIATAFRKGGPTDLRELLVARKLADPDALESAIEYARARGHDLADTLLDRGLVDAEGLDGARRGHAEEVVLDMFSWRSGEFSFEVRTVDATEGGELFIEPGLNPQFLALEGTRQYDESEHALATAASVVEPGSQPADGEFVDPLADVSLDQVDDEPLAEVEDAPAPLAAIASEPASEVLAETIAEPLAQGGAGAEALVEARLAEEGEDLQPALLADEGEAIEPVQAGEAIEPVPAEGEAAAFETAQARPRSGSQGPPPPLVVIDPSLAVLEWVKGALEHADSRVHVFQTSELGISRIRQYLARRELPRVLIAADAPADTLSGARDTAEIVRRLRAQAPRMEVYVLSDAEPSGADGLRKPDPTELSDPRAAERRGALAAALREALRIDAGSQGPARPPDAPQLVDELKAASARLRAPRGPAEVLGEVLDFASRSFRRAALFMVREDDAIGLVQRGLAEAGGPDDTGLRSLCFPIAAVPWLRAAVEGGAPVRHEAAEEADMAFAAKLGDGVPSEVFVAPIESSGRVVALVYCDMLPGGEPLPDTAALEVVVHQAGLALDRAALEHLLTEG